MTDLLAFSFGDINTVLRAVLIPLSLFTLWWTRHGPWQLLRGFVCPTSFNRSGYFCLGLATIGFQFTYFASSEVGEGGPWTLLWLFILCSAHLLAATGYLLGHIGLLDRFFWLVTSNHLKAALAMANYHAVDPKAAEALAAELELKTARAITEVTKGE